jgi:hypothetical protein
LGKGNNDNRLKKGNFAVELEPVREQTKKTGAHVDIWPEFYCCDDGQFRESIGQVQSRQGKQFRTTSLDRWSASEFALLFS